ncbi:MAG: cupredoxin domain-containing protein [Chloroflexi bacterium]|nr:cupredoxin domain-containing protein [Chloroflexota bacterium]
MLPESSLLGSLLAGLFGYRSAPTVLELGGYVAYLLPVLFLFVGRGRPTRTVASAAASVVLALAIVGCTGGSPSTTGAASGAGNGSSRPATVIEVKASEYAFNPASISVPAGIVSFHVTNDGQEEHEFEIFQADRVVDEIEGLVPGLDRTLTVELAAGEYSYKCLLEDHDQRGMTGALTVTGG